MTRLQIVRAMAGTLLLLAPVAPAWPVPPEAPLAPRDVPAKTVPVPGTVSPELQAVIAQPLRAGWGTPPDTPEGWARLVAQLETSVGAATGPMANRLHVDIAPSTIDGVKVYTLTPQDTPCATGTACWSTCMAAATC